LDRSEFIQSHLMTTQILIARITNPRMNLKHTNQNIVLSYKLLKNNREAQHSKQKGPRTLGKVAIIDFTN